MASTAFHTRGLHVWQVRIRLWESNLRHEPMLRIAGTSHLFHPTRSTVDDSAQTHHVQRPRPIQTPARRLHCYVSIILPCHYHCTEAAPQNSFMGPTGSGKTNVREIIVSLTPYSQDKNGQFINNFTGNSEQRSARNLKSDTKNVTPYPVMYHDLRLVLVDTPGFDDTYRPDSVILRIIADWLTQKYVIL